MRGEARLALISLLFATSALAETPIAAPALRPATGSQDFPVLASSGADALAAWEDQRAPIQYDVYASRISADGAPAGDGGTPISPTIEQERSPAVVWNGDEYVVAQLMAPRPLFDGGIRLTRVKPNDASDNRFIPRDKIGGPAGFFDRLAMAWNGSEYLLVLNSHGLLVDRSFHAIGSAFAIGSGGAKLASVASDGSGFLVVWEDGAALVSPGGSVTPLEALSQSTTAPAIVWNGERYLVIWSDPVVRARFVDRNGNPSSGIIDVFSAGRETAVAWNGSEYLIAFATEQAVDAVRLDAAGKVLDAAPFPIAAGDHPAAIGVGGRFLVAWAGQDSIRSEVVDASGAPSLQRVVALSLGEQQFARGVFDGSNFGFVWNEDGAIRFSRVRPDGGPLDGAGVQLGTGQSPRIAFNGSEYLVTWGRQAVRIDREGHVLDETPFVIPELASDLATDGGDFLALEAQPTPKAPGFDRSSSRRPARSCRSRSSSGRSSVKAAFPSCGMDRTMWSFMANGSISNVSSDAIRGTTCARRCSTAADGSRRRSGRSCRGHPRPCRRSTRPSPRPAGRRSRSWRPPAPRTS